MSESNESWPETTWMKKRLLVLSKKREEENVTKWHSLYGEHDFWDPKLYDLVIDTDENGIEETGEKVLEMLNF
ncbi:MAG: hypothetical protein UZ21_OP11001001029 [Microgenomates bacterium OLB22]|nr:MAG: hypothetical protein UZ21_OP11001001029 [Microgenomates bacterium OLB22]